MVVRIKKWRGIEPRPPPPGEGRPPAGNYRTYARPLGAYFKDPKSTPQYAQEAIDYGSLEANTGLRWIDGRVIYRETVSIGALPNNTSKSVAHGIGNLRNFTQVWGIAISGTTSLPMPYADTAAVGNQIEIYATGTNVVVVTGTNRGAYTGYVVLEYTKN